MKLIPLEEVEKILTKLESKDVNVRNTLMTAGCMLKSTATIDPIEEIDKMIEGLKSKYENKSKGSLDWLAYKSGHDTLQELKSRLSLTQK